MSRIIKKVSNQIASHLGEHVKFPQIEAEWEFIRQNEYNIAGMPGVGGCIDCTHIKIQNPDALIVKYFEIVKDGFFKTFK